MNLLHILESFYIWPPLIQLSSRLFLITTPSTYKASDQAILPVITLELCGDLQRESTPGYLFALLL